MIFSNIKNHLNILISSMLILGLSGCATSSTTLIYNQQYNVVENKLASVVNFRNEQNIEGLHYSTINNPDLTLYLADYPPYKIIEQSPGEKLKIKMFNRYNMFGSGEIGLLFSLNKIDNENTSVEVDYFDNGYLFGFIPIIKSGTDQEYFIHQLLFSEFKAANKPSE